MKEVYIGSKKQILKLYPEDGYKLTTFDEETQDIVFFEWYNSVATTEERAKKFYEISDEKVKELDAKKELAMNEVFSETDGTETTE